MTPDQLKQYLTVRNQAISPEDLVGRFLFELVGQGNGQSGQLSWIQQFLQSEAAKDEQHDQTEDQNAIVTQRLLAAIQQTVEVKEVDFSDVLQAVSLLIEQVHAGDSAMIDVLRAIQDKDDENVVAGLSRVEEAIRTTEQPEPVDMTPVVVSQEKGFRLIAEGLTRLALEIKETGKIEEVAIKGKVSLSKPSWWKDWTFDWAPLSALLSPIQSVLEKIAAKKLPEIPVKDGRVLVMVDRVGGGGGGTNMGIVEERLAEWVFNNKETVGGYTYYGFDSVIGWKIKQKTVADGSWKIARGNGPYDDAWFSKATKVYNSH